MVAYFVFRLAVFLARHLPERWGSAIACWLGAMVYRLSPLAEAGRDNVRHVLGPDTDPSSVARLTRQVFQQRLLNYYDLLRLPDFPAAEVNRRVTYEGLEHVEWLLAKKQGAVVTSGHVGPMELMIQALASLGYPLLGITEHLKHERLQRYIMNLRTTHGLSLITTGGSLLDVYRRVKRGEVLLSALDRDSTDTGRVVHFFGAPAWMPDGYARLAVRANVPLIFGFCYRAGDGVRVRVFPPVYPNASLGKEEAVRDLVERMLRLLEEAIRAHPEQWHLSTPIWRLARERLEGEGAR